MTIVTITQL